MLLIVLFAIAVVYVAVLAVVIGLCADAARGDRALLKGTEAPSGAVSMHRQYGTLGF